MTYHVNPAALSKKSLTEGNFVESNISRVEPGEIEVDLFRKRVKARVTSPAGALFSMRLDLSPEYSSRQRIFHAIQSLYQSYNNPRDRQLADRLTALYRDALAENESILADSASQFSALFLNHRDLGLPKVTLSWIRGTGNFTAVEFTGEPMAKLVAEIPREHGLIARYFSTEPLGNVVSAARAVGASFA